MMRYKYFSVWAAFFAFALVVPGVGGAEKLGNQPGGAKGETPKDVQKQLDAINEDLKKLLDGWKSTNDSLKFNFGEVSKDMKKLQEDLKDLKDEKMTMQLHLSKALEKIKNLEDSLTNLQSEMGTLKNKVDIKLYPPSNHKVDMTEITARLDYMEMLLKQIKASASYQAKASPVPTAGKGRVVLVNSTSEEVLFIVNNKAYRLVPNSQQALESFPAGFFSYEVVSPTFGTLRKNTTSVNAGETFTISVG